MTNKHPNYQTTVKNLVQEFYDLTKAYSPSRHYFLSYSWIQVNFDLDMNRKENQDVIWDMIATQEFRSLIQTLDFDDDRQRVLILIWDPDSNKKHQKFAEEKIKEIAKQIVDCLECCNFGDVTDSSGFVQITDTCSVDVYKSRHGDSGEHYVIYCSYNGDDFDYRYTTDLSSESLAKEFLDIYYDECQNNN
jgi:hypothetical protein